MNIPLVALFVLSFLVSPAPRWEYSPTYYINVEGSPIPEEEFISLVETAFDIWTEGLSVKPEYLGTTPLTPLSEDGVNVIGWRSDYLGPYGKTGIWSTSGTIQEVDIEFNPRILTRRQGCLNANVLHETGHFLGLDDRWSGVMSPMLTFPCTQWPSQENFEDLWRLYPE